MTQTVSSGEKHTANRTPKIKFLYSYGGKIVVRPSDGKLRYAGGFTRVLSVDRSITYTELMVRFVESCGFSTVLKCKLPSEDLDVLVTIRSDEEFRNLIDEYERASSSIDWKIIAVLFPVKSAKEKKLSQPSSPVSCLDFPPQRVKSTSVCTSHHRCTSTFVVGYPIGYGCCVDQRHWRLRYCSGVRRRV